MAIEARSAPHIGRSPLLFIQYGAFREALRNLREGGEEDYQAQRRSVEFAVGLATADRPIAVVNLVTETAFDEWVPEGPRVIGLGPQGHAIGARAWWRLLDRVSPARIVLRTPLWPVMLWAARKRRPLLIVLADSFHAGGWRARLRNLLFTRLMKASAVQAIGNHGRRASFQLAEMGVPRAKIVPWDWAPIRTPYEFTAKAEITRPGTMSLLFAGALVTEKGVDDLLEAAALLVQQGKSVRVDILGGGDAERLRTLANQLEIASSVTVHGKVPNREVLSMMRSADAVVVPSRHEYPEGLPLTIYEALVSRSPIIASDHPMFEGNIVDGESALIYPAGDVTALADRIERLANDNALYGHLSRNGAVAWQRLQLPVTFEDLVAHWLSDDATWLRAHSLAGRDYRMTAGDDGPTSC